MYIYIMHTRIVLLVGNDVIAQTFGAESHASDGQNVLVDNFPL